MARSRTAAVAAVLFVVVVTTLVATAPLAASAAAVVDACTEDCNKKCGKENKDPACSTQCDEICRAKAASSAYAGDKPAEKAAATKALDRDSGAAVDAAGTPAKAAALADACFDECAAKNCGGKRSNESGCSARCASICRDEVESLAFAADTYVAATPAEKAKVVKTLDKQADGPADKVAVFADVCIKECNRLCGKGKTDPACAATCDTGCQAKAVSVAYAKDSPAKKEAVKEEIATTGANAYP